MKKFGVLSREESKRILRQETAESEVQMDAKHIEQMKAESRIYEIGPQLPRTV
jgi:hypothetical protein